MSEGCCSRPAVHVHKYDDSSDDDDTQRLILAGRVDDVGGKVLNAISDSSRDLSGTLCDMGRDHQKSFHDLQDSVNSHTTALGLSVADDIKDSTYSIKEDIKDHSHRIQDANEGNFRENRLTSNSQFGEVKNLLHGLGKDQLIETLKLKNQISKGNSAILSRVQKSKNQLERQAADNNCEVKLSIIKNKEKLAKQIAECCEKTHEKIEKTACDTQQLIRETENQRLREQLADLRQQLALLSLGGGVVTPV